MRRFRCKHGKLFAFCTGCFVQTFSFPIEHGLWEKAPGFSMLTKALGL